MNQQLKEYIEQNIDLLETDIVKFVMTIPGSIDRTEELYFALLNANIDIPVIVTYMVAILNAYNRYSPYSYNISTTFENILEDNGASEDDSGPYGFLTGMSESQIHEVFVAFKDVIKDMMSDDYYIYPETEKLFNL